MKFGWKQAGRKFPWYGIVGMVVGGLALAVLFAFLFGWVVMLLWNRIMPDIFGLKTISYWQAWGLVILAHILVKPGYGGKSGGKAGGRPRMGARGALPPGAGRSALFVRGAPDDSLHHGQDGQR